MLRKPEAFQQEGSKVFRRAPVNTASRPSAQEWITRSRS